MGARWGETAARWGGSGRGGAGSHHPTADLGLHSSRGRTRHRHTVGNRHTFFVLRCSLLFIAVHLFICGQLSIIHPHPHPHPHPGAAAADRVVAADCIQCIVMPCRICPGQFDLRPSAFCLDLSHVVSRRSLRAPCLCYVMLYIERSQCYSSTLAFNGLIIHAFFVRRRASTRPEEGSDAIVRVVTVQYSTSED